MRGEHDEADEVGGVAGCAEDPPAVGRLVHRTGIGWCLDEVRLSLRLEPDNRGARKQNLEGRRMHATTAKCRRRVLELGVNLESHDVSG